jgi:elongator complex protein 1
LEIPGDTPETDERCRNIERGGKVVTAVPSKFALSLQMPRGNLEIIYPRALVLAGIRQYIENKKYNLAYLTCRSHMVDMNILHDYFPAQFMANIELFVKQVKRVDYIDEFLSRLKFVTQIPPGSLLPLTDHRNEDVCETVYQDTLKIAHSTERAPEATRSTELTGGGSAAITKKDNKVNRICDGLLAVLSNMIDTNLKNLVTAHVCKSPPDLEAGLQLVASLRGMV